MERDERGESARATILWMLSLGQLISWGLVYYTFPLFVVPMDAGTRLVAQRDVRRAVGRPAGGGPLLDPGRRLDRSRARPHADDRRLAAGGRDAGRCGRSVDSLPVFYALWIGLGACQSVTLYEPAFAVITRVYGPRYRQAILLMTFLGGLASTFGIPVRPAPDRAHRLAADARR